MTEVVETAPRLSDLTEAERAARFARLQERLGGVWGGMRLNQPGESIVVVPSVTPDGPHTTGAPSRCSRSASCSSCCCSASRACR